MPVLLAQTLATAQVFEAAMLISFGISWPVDIVKAWRTRQTAGKSLAFMMLVLIGYLAGLTGKCIRASAGPLEPVTILYALNALFVAVDISLYLRFRPAPQAVTAKD